VGYPDLGLFGPGSVTWRLHQEPILWLAGVRALFLQALHPRAMAGVAQNSDYRRDSAGRLLRTANYVGTVIFGTTAQAERAGQRLRRLHARMTAVDPDTGETFRVDSPELLRWVHVTEVESFLTVARRAGAPISAADANRYLTEQLRAAALVGLDPDDVPGTVAEVEEYYTATRPELRRTPDAVGTARFLLFPPMPYGLGFTLARPAWTAVAATAFGLLPSWARRLYGLPVPDLPAALTARTIRLALSALPQSMLHSPLYKDAMRRAARAA